MLLIPLGLVTVATAGVPVQLTADALLLTTKVKSIFLQPLDSNTGKVYFGKDAAYQGAAGTVTVTFLGSTGAGVMKTFMPPAATGINDWYMLPDYGNQYLVSEFKLDASINTQKAYATLLIN